MCVAQFEVLIMGCVCECVGFLGSYVVELTHRGLQHSVI